jgi:hypothetical protein
MTFFEKLFALIHGRQWYPDEKRYTVSFKANENFVYKIDALAYDGDCSKVIVRAIALYTHAIEQEKAGKKLGFFVEEDGKDVIKQVVSLCEEPYFKT